MERRTGDTPMDFQWDDRQGKVDAASPWMRGDPRKGGYSSSFASTAAKPFGTSSFTAPGQAFSSSRAAVPSTPVHSSVAGYRENPAAAVAFSDTENPSSPDAGATDDAATPEASPEPAGPRALSSNVAVFRGTSTSLFNSLPARFRPSSYTSAAAGRGRPGGGAVMLRKVHAKRKRPRFDADTALQPYEGSDGDDSPAPPRSLSGRFARGGGDPPPPQALAVVPAFFSYLHAHPDLPRILSSYAQTLLTYFLMALLVFLVWSAWSAVRSDVDLAVQEAAGELVREVARCAEEFRRNGCGAAAGAPPALATACREWHDCMSLDPLAVGRARVGARTFSTILNGFFEGMSWKFLAFVFVLLLAVVGNGRALVLPFTGGAGARGAGQAVPYGQGRWDPGTEFSAPYFAPDVPRTPARSPSRRDASPSKRAWAEEQRLMASPSRSPRKLAYL